MVFLHASDGASSAPIRRWLDGPRSPSGAMFWPACGALLRLLPPRFPRYHPRAPDGDNRRWHMKKNTGDSSADCLRDIQQDKAW